MAVVLLACSTRKVPESMLLNSDLVDLKGKTTFTIIINSTSDTLKLEAAIFGMIPIAEEITQLSVAPGESDTISFSQSYPDFIYLNNNEIDFKLFNSPGNKLICDIRSMQTGNYHIVFSGELSPINDYYLAHQNHFGGKYEHNRPYYEAGDAVKDFDDYPAIVDSITGMSRAFLNQYKAPLPEWFVAFENARLNFKSGLMKHNCLLTKEFYEAHTIPRSPSYFDFDKSLSLMDNSIVLCHDYISYAQHRIQRAVKDKKTPDELRPEYHLIDSLYGTSTLGDLLRTAMLSHAALSSLPDFRNQLAQINFGDSTYRLLIDSLVTERLGTPANGKRSPDPLLSDIEGNRVKLSNHKGNVLLLNFWATWCGPCIKEFPSENEIHRKYGDKGFLIVNICVESRADKWKALTQEHELKMVNLFVSPDEYGSVKRLFDLSSFPRSVLVDKNFVVLENHAVRASEIDESDIQEWLRRD